MPTQDISLTDTIVELTALLADRYRVERELGRGGMATVYLAHDLKHDRPVALKVMHLEIAAGLGVERFVREVRLTARLQHPHILPVFDSGTVAGRPWYSMPYVPGESLRDRLRREVQLPVDTAVEIARQVALALDAAHRQGAVHRDVKPENILLCDGQALIADFGIARAIDSAGEERITSSGLAVGTPAYMAPEQAGGGPIDGRADVYALGCVLYEMLAGEPPVTGATPQAIIAKRLAQPPPSLLVVRPSVPKPVDQAVRKALALVPADRFAGAAQLAEALVLKPARASARSAAWGMLGLGVAILIAGAYLLHRARPPSPPTLLSAGVLRARDPLLIADFESPAGDSVLGPTVTEAFRIDLTGSPVVTVMTAPMVDSALMRMRRPVSARLDGALAREVALREGVKAVVTGQVARVMGSYLVSAEVIAVASGEVLAAHRETAADSTRLIDAIDRLSGRLRERIGESLRSVREEPRLERVTTGSLEALWKFTKAIHVGDFESDYVRAVALLQEAVALDTGFATAYRTLGTYQGFLGDREGEVAALTRAVRHRDRLTESEREHTRALYHALVTGRLDQSVAAYRALLERRPADTAARNNLGAFYNALHQPARAESILRAGLDTVRPWGPGIHVNLAYSLVALGRRPEAERMLEQGARLFPGNRAFAWYRVRLATSRGDYSAAASNARAFLDRYGETPAERIAPLRELAGIALVRGRLTEAEQRFGEAMAAAAEARSYAAYLEAAAALGYLHVWFRRDPARGLETVAAALARYPLDSIAVLQRPYLTLAFLYASAGQPQRARALLGMYQRGVDPELRRIHEPRLRWTWGQVALAEGRFADAIREFRAYLPSPRDCLPCGHATLARAYDGAGNADSALALYERYLALPSADRLNESHLFEDDATQLAPACKRLGELYEQRGERDKATKYYRRFVALWQEADPELRPAVGEITQRLRQ